MNENILKFGIISLGDLNRCKKEVMGWFKERTNQPVTYKVTHVEGHPNGGVEGVAKLTDEEWRLRKV